MFKVNPSSFGGVFALPREIADDELKMASGDMLKVLLYVFRRADSPLTPEEIAEGTGVKPEEVLDALLYWERRAYINDTEKTATTEKTEEKTAEAQSPEKAPDRVKTVSVKPSKPSYEVICKRMEESIEVRELFNEAQLKLGRTIGTSDQSVLLLLHDYYGLPVEVILAICEYARTHNKSNNINYIYTVGTDWSKREIDSIEAADEELKKLESLNAEWEKFRGMTGVKTKKPTVSQQKYLAVWRDEWKFSFDMLLLAFEEMSKHTDGINFAYMNKILSEWKRRGIETPEQAAEKEKEFREQKEKAAEKKGAYSNRTRETKKESSPASYDIEKAIKQMKTGVPALKKKEKR